MKKEFINLGRQPIANGFLKDLKEAKDEFKFDLGATFDDETGLVSLTNFVDKEKLFNENYIYWSSMSKTMNTHFKQAAETIRKRFNFGPHRKLRVLEIGSNDGVFMKNFSIKEIVGVEPCANFAEYTMAMGYKTYNKFWNMETAEQILKEHGQFDVVFAANCFCHILEIEEAIKAASHVLSCTGLLIFEDPSLLSMIQNNAFEQIYDEHAHIFSVTAVEKLLNKDSIWMNIHDVEHFPNIHGGSNRIYASKSLSSAHQPREVNVLAAKAKERLIHGTGLQDFKTYENFARDVKDNVNNLFHYMLGLCDAGERIVAYGATSKSTVLYNFHKGVADMVDFIIDSTPSKDEMYSPGVHIPVMNSPIPHDVNFVLLTAWNFKDEITKKESEFLNRGGTFILYIPSFHKITKDGVSA